MSKISIVGGSGFVGTNLCKLLYDKNIDFEILDIKKSLRFPEKWKYVDIRDKNSIKENLTGKIVIHLAAVHRDDVVNKSEYFILACLAVPTLFFGFYPDPLINTIEVSVKDLINMYNINAMVK